MGKVTVVGSFVQDHAWLVDEFPRVGETRIAQRFVSGAGGKGFNQAIAAHRLQADVCFIGAIGQDHLGAAAKAFALDNALNCAWLELNDQPTAASSIVVDRHGNNLISVALAANAWLSVEFVREQLAQAAPPDVVLAQLEVNLGATREALNAARREGALSMLNPAPLHADLDRELLALADVITPNETEFRSLLRQLFGIELEADFFNATDEALHGWCRSTGVATVVITLGAQGVFVSHDAPELHGDAHLYYRLPAAPVSAIDSTGAGDAFSGALACALAEQDQKPFRELVEFAINVAGYSTEVIGTALAMPTRAQLAQRFGLSA